MINRDRAIGTFIGLAVGDALGAPVEFKQAGTFPPVTGYRKCKHFNLPIGGWTDDTIMALALAESLIATRGELMCHDVMNRWAGWMTHGGGSYTGTCFDIGNQTRKALNHWHSRGVCLPPDANAIGNGCIMRLAPLAIVKRRTALTYAARVQASWTHPSAHAASAATDLALILDELITTGASDHLEEEASEQLPARHNGTAHECLVSAMWAVHHHDTFEAAVLAAVNLGDDADTVGAVAGMMAGAKFGMHAIPVRWVNLLMWNCRLITVADQLVDIANATPE